MQPASGQRNKSAAAYHFGTRGGVALRDPIDAGLRAELGRALLEWKVLFFRGQDDAAADRAVPPVEHPVVRVHPETGRKTIFVSRVTQHIVGLDPLESERLLDGVESAVRSPEYQCRFRWTAGSVAFWDNRATQHYASSDYFPAGPVMDRVSIVGDRPFGPTGSARSGGSVALAVTDVTVRGGTSSAALQDHHTRWRVGHVIGKVPAEGFPDRRDVSTVRSVSSTREAEIMKKMRKGIVMLVVAASAAVGVAGSATGAQAATVKPTAVAVTVKTTPPVANSFGSVWM